MEAYPQEDYDYAYEHDVRLIIEGSKEEESEEEEEEESEEESKKEKSEKDTRVRSFYDPKTNTWEVEINYGDYIFKGKVSPKGIPTEGVISHKNADVCFNNNNKKLSPKGFAHTIKCIFQDKMNEKIQEYYEKEKKDGKAYTAYRYIHDSDIIQEEDNENSGEEEGNVIHEEPTQSTQQPQNQSNLNLKSGQSQQSGLRKNK